MGALAEYKSFFKKAALICLGGFLIMGLFTVCIVWAQTSTTSPAMLVHEGSGSYNAAGSYVITGMAPLTVKPTDKTPKYVTNALKEQRGVVLLVYLKGSTDDQEMVANFEAVKAKYAAQASFFNFESKSVSMTGDLLDQLRIIAPPALAVISPDGSVYQAYTGWIDRTVMEQVVANAVRQ
jgi:hypothetical protein